MGGSREVLIRKALFDPGRFVEREFYPNQFPPSDPEPLHQWQTRAVLAALDGAGGRQKDGAMNDKTMPGVMRGPKREIDQYWAEQRALARLSQAVWSVSGFKSYDEIREYVEGVLREIESDEP